MSTRDYLKSVRKLFLEIESKKRQREQLFYIVTGSSIKLKKIDVQTSTAGDRLGDTMAEVADLDRSIRRDIEILCNEQNRVRAMFQELSRPEYRAIMTDYYLNAYSWERVAELNGYSLDWTYALHGKALKELERQQ